MKGKALKLASMLLVIVIATAAFVLVDAFQGDRKFDRTKVMGTIRMANGLELGVVSFNESQAVPFPVQRPMAKRAIESIRKWLWIQQVRFVAMLRPNPTAYLPPPGGYPKQDKVMTLSEMDYLTLQTYSGLIGTLPDAQITTSKVGSKLVLVLDQPEDECWKADNLLVGNQHQVVERKDGLATEVRAVTTTLPYAGLKLELGDDKGHWVVLDGPLFPRRGQGLAVALGPMLPRDETELTLRVTLGKSPPALLKLKNPVYVSPSKQPPQKLVRLPHTITHGDFRGTFNFAVTQSTAGGAETHRIDFSYSSERRGFSMEFEPGVTPTKRLIPLAWSVGPHGFVTLSTPPLWPGTRTLTLQTRINLGSSHVKIAEDQRMSVPVRYTPLATFRWTKRSSETFTLTADAATFGISKIGRWPRGGGAFFIQHSAELTENLIALVGDHPAEASLCRIKASGPLIGGKGQKEIESLVGWAEDPPEGSQVVLAMTPQSRPADPVFTFSLDVSPPPAR